MKEQEKSPEKELNKVEASKLLDTEFKTMVIRVLNEPSENFNSIKKGLENHKKENQSEMENTLTEMKNILQGINSVVKEAEDQISDLEYKEAENTQ